MICINHRVDFSIIIKFSQILGGGGGGGGRTGPWVGENWILGWGGGGGGDQFPSPPRPLCMKPW